MTDKIVFIVTGMQDESLPVYVEAARISGLLHLVVTSQDFLNGEIEADGAIAFLIDGDRVLDIKVLCRMLRSTSGIIVVITADEGLGTELLTQGLATAVFHKPVSFYQINRMLQLVSYNSPDFEGDV